MMTMRKALIVLPAAAMLLAGCGSSPAATPTALALLHKIPSCTTFVSETPDVMAVNAGVCDLADGGQVWLQTFRSMSGETQWIGTGGDPASPDTAFYGCCIEGSLWAATIDGTGPGETYYHLVIHAIGGRQVSP